MWTEQIPPAILNKVHPSIHPPLPHLFLAGSSTDKLHTLCNVFTCFRIKPTMLRLLVLSAVLLLSSAQLPGSRDCPDNDYGPRACTCTIVPLAGIDHRIIDCQGKGLDVLPTDVPADTFSLDLSNNAITELTANAFQNLNSLEQLILTGNQISTIPDGAFNGLDDVKVLKLNENRLTALTDGMFSNMVSLEELHLDDNQIATVTGSPFSGLERVRDLKLNANRMVNLPTTVFQGLATLQKLYLHDNFVTSIPSQAIRSLDTLIELHLNNNDIMNVGNDSFVGLTSVLNISLSGQPNLVEVEAYALRGVNRNLERLEIRDCPKLTTLHEETFRDFVQLQRLDLSNNNISRLPKAALENLNRLALVTLSGNPWICDCRLSWLRDWMDEPVMNPDLLDVNNVVCAAPPKLRDQQLETVNRFDLDDEDVCNLLNPAGQIGAGQVLVASLFSLLCALTLSFTV
ncbi:chondroadherin-like isoform X1 [Branchiostoma lanceolatum]|uniref:chondroadherin-like isoform X1 n=2 Tax=Branchiostoma lanceolatum TaxID=7740 RepID=UPI0034533996